MNQKQIKALLAAGVFSATLLGAQAYAHDEGTTPKKDKKAAHKKMKGNSCAGHNSCKGKGGCKSGDQGCAGKNSCKGKGGCATGDYHMKAEGDGATAAPAPAAEAPSAAGSKATDKHACSGKNGCGGK